MEKKITKKNAILVSIALLLVLAILSPKRFGAHVDPADVASIEVFDGQTGTGYTIVRPEQISYIVENIQSHPVIRSGISLGAMGYSLRITYVDYNDKAIIPPFILNEDWLIRADPFFYRCGGGLCYNYIKSLSYLAPQPAEDGRSEYDEVESILMD